MSQINFERTARGTTDSESVWKRCSSTKYYLNNKDRWVSKRVVHHSNLLPQIEIQSEITDQREGGEKEDSIQHLLNK